jgi:hypothetical protein
MLKAILDTKDGRRMLLLILERTNIKHLEKGNSVHVHAEEMNMRGFNVDEILISFFETKEDALSWFAEKELIDENTLFPDERESN